MTLAALQNIHLAVSGNDVVISWSAPVSNWLRVSVYVNGAINVQVNAPATSARIKDMALKSFQYFTKVIDPTQTGTASPVETYTPAGPAPTPAPSPTPTPSPAPTPQPLSGPRVYCKQTIAGVGAMHVDVVGMFASEAAQFAATISMDWGDPWAAMVTDPRNGQLVSSNNIWEGWAGAHQYSTAGTYYPVLTVNGVPYPLGPVSIQACPFPRYFVDPINGNDGNPGATSAAPFKSLAPIQKLLRSGLWVSSASGSTIIVPSSLQIGALSDVIFDTYGDGPATLLMPKSSGDCLFSTVTGITGKTATNITIRNIIGTSDATATDALANGPKFISGAGNNIAIINCTFGELTHGIMGVSGDGFHGALIQGCNQTRPNSVRQYDFSAFTGNNVHCYGHTSPGSVAQPSFRVAGTGLSYSSVVNSTLAETTNTISGANLRCGKWIAWSKNKIGTMLALSAHNDQELIENFIADGNVINGYIDLRPGLRNVVISNSTVTGSNPPVLVQGSYPAGQVSDDHPPVRMDDMKIESCSLKNIAYTGQATQFMRVMSQPTTGIVASGCTMNGKAT